VLSIKVTNINNEYHARLLEDNKVCDEMSCKKKEDIGWICREMMQWYCKLGGNDPWAKSARARHNEEYFIPQGIKYLRRSIK
jgi:hypothetical protein